jgi:hypothetical protein
MVDGISLELVKSWKPQINDFARAPWTFYLSGMNLTWLDRPTKMILKNYWPDLKDYFGIDQQKN